jgi:hypothetical protein
VRALHREERTRQQQHRHEEDHARIRLVVTMSTLRVRVG